MGIKSGFGLHERRGGGGEVCGDAGRKRPFGKLSAGQERKLRDLEAIFCESVDCV